MLTGYDMLSEDEEFEEALSKKQIRAQIMKKVVDMPSTPVIGAKVSTMSDDQSEQPKVDSGKVDHAISMPTEPIAAQAQQQAIPADLNAPIDLNQERDDLEVDKEVTVESSMQPDEETMQPDEETQLAEQKARLDEQQKQLEQVLPSFTVQPMPLAAPTAVQAPVKPPTAYHIPKSWSTELSKKSKDKEDIVLFSQYKVLMLQMTCHLPTNFAQCHGKKNLDEGKKYGGSTLKR
uniref:Uncharacterized protein n=1 Tax=Romanomermis culicivorax TaxID=13658 RepID=A0A915IS27_ROMCU